MSGEHVIDNRMVYLSSVRVSDAPEGYFARVLRHDCSGERYYAPPKPEKPKRRSMAQNPKPFNEKGAAMAREFVAGKKAGAR